MSAPRIEVLAIGAELVEGRTVDTNSAEIAQALADSGFSAAMFHAVGDDAGEITRALKDILQRADVCVCTGGLGPTLDDLTREAVALICGVRLKMDEESLKAVQGFFAKSGRAMPESNRRQAMFPEGAEIIGNRQGTAPGFAVGCGKGLIVCLPGVPGEMRPMLRESVMPLLRKRFPAPHYIRIKTLRLFGISESAVADALGDLMKRENNPLVGTNASLGNIGITIRSEGPDLQRVTRMLAETEERVKALVGKYVYGEGKMSLEEALAQLLEKYNLTIGVAESCTGGLIGNLLTNVPGISRFYVEGIICYSNESKVQRLGVPEDMIHAKGAVSDEVARAMAEGIRNKAGADLGIGVTGIAGPGGGTPQKPVGLVYIAVADAKGTTSREFRFSGDRQAVRMRSALTALNLTRLRILDIERSQGEIMP